MKQDLCVFVVDDVPVIAYTLSAILREHGHSVIPYTDPLRALSDVQSLRPDVLITDFEMPSLNGVDLARQVVMRCPQCKVFLMSGHEEPIEPLDVARANGLELPLFPKPVSASVFAERLDDIRTRVV